MRKGVIILACLIVLGFSHTVIFLFGASRGMSGAAQTFHEQDVLNKDVNTLRFNYQTMWGLCEQKFVSANTGDVANAIRLNGQIDTLRSESEKLEAKYSRKPI